MTDTNGAAYHLARVRASYDEPNSPTDVVNLEALEYLLSIRAEAETHAQEFIDRSKAKTESTGPKAMREAIRQDFVDMLSRVKLAQEVAEMWETMHDKNLQACGRRILEILGRPVK